MLALERREDPLQRDRQLGDTDADGVVDGVGDESEDGHHRAATPSREVDLQGDWSGNLSDEMRRLTELLADARVTAQQAMLMHLDVLEEMIQGLGNRSARHVMTRADLLILDLVAKLSDGYRRRLMNRLYPPRQMMLPGFDDPPISLGEEVTGNG